MPQEPISGGLASAYQKLIRVYGTLEANESDDWKCTLYCTDRDQIHFIAPGDTFRLSINGGRNGGVIVDGVHLSSGGEDYLEVSSTTRLYPVDRDQ